MTIYGVLTRKIDPELRVGVAADPEAACEIARLHARNPPDPNHLLVVLATLPKGEWTHVVYDVSALCAGNRTAPLTVNAVQSCAITGHYFVDFL